eukprot:CAMPEP_0201618900 /NCGR_PEP_ID=MMETSP0492-20130828/40259_1 /ASSEMBLY_ACC=CAM_ASM_000837 /TAXON_ID=420259 /ORGANISM="Thalassiosira gravida, Strain GMp14c1" /LENGTH=248 /DNA_ID=CAMNT_0048087627 /DNA_START=33 /DNA_END=779 /DNA_ORIENTATION=+
MSIWATVLVVLCVTTFKADAFAPNNGLLSFQQRSADVVAQPKTTLSMAEIKTPDMEKATLTVDTTWRLRLLLNDVKTAKGKKLDGQLFVVEGNFIEEEGYEPPQGLFTPTGTPSSDEQVEEGDKSESDGGMFLEVSNSRWKLSEDPDDPKDGLWIWGLFKEPLYPFMLLQIETKELTLSSSADEENADSIPPLKLYAQINHFRNKDEGTVKLQTANLNIRILEQIQLPGATVDLFEEEAVGQVSFQPL